MSAHIVFANGSKQMSHNNDDLFERWLFRRYAQANHVASSPDIDTEAPEFVPLLPPIYTVPQAKALRTGLTEREFILVGHRKVHLDEFNTGRINQATYASVAVDIKAELKKVADQKRAVADWLKAHNPITDKYTLMMARHDEEREMLQERCDRLYAENFELKRRLAEFEAVSP